ncbi:MAG TPA: 2-octaprenyl-6-methoxyphenyl hydroxylase, partial [Burkholderiaceae bacterium]|nr:2-octaprenyl-6-methoxyphenyl hydroxylase [Burkholderiaceae bacterium]
MTNTQPLAILGGGPVGLVLALLLARRRVPSVLFDARSIEQARADRRLLALSLGSLQTISALTELPEDVVAPIRSVIVSSVGQYGRAVIDEGDTGAGMLGATIRYGDLIAALAAAAESSQWISVRRSRKVSAVRQTPSSVEVELDGDQRFNAPLALNAEGLGTSSAASTSHAALVADLDVVGLERGTACERFTRDGPLALLPLPARTPSSAHRMALVWCMTNAQADRRIGLSDAQFTDEVSAQLGERKLRVSAIQSRARYPLYEQERDEL